MSTATKKITARSRRQAPKPALKWTRGARLLCIDDSNLRRQYKPGSPVRGHVYSVREVFADDSDGGRLGVLLVGIEGPIQPNGLEQGFYFSRFRSLD